MSLIVTGSIATDHLMTFPGRFTDSLVVDQLDKIALSFLVEDLEVRRGGCAANIAFGLGSLGLRPVLAGASPLRGREEAPPVDRREGRVEGVVVRVHVTLTVRPPAGPHPEVGTDLVAGAAGSVPGSGGAGGAAGPGADPGGREGWP